MRKFVLLLVVIGLSSVLIAPVWGNSYSDNNEQCRVNQTNESSVMTQQPVNDSQDRGNYTGTIRVYVSEPTGRWRDDTNRNYEHAFLDFALTTPVSVAYQDTYQQTVTWDAAAEGFTAITEENIEVFAVLFNSAGHTMYSNPPTGAPFTAHDVDATCCARPGETGSDTAYGAYTHTVFIEEGSATW
jgi:type II secretory pathway pseudopilin PulG